jgi:hypothetical protein
MRLLTLSRRLHTPDMEEMPQPKFLFGLFNVLLSGITKAIYVTVAYCAA